MKKIFSFAFLLMVLAVGFATASCSGSDDEGGDSSELTATLQQSKWVSKNYDDIYGDDWVLSDQETTTLYFVNDHQCVVYYFRKSYDSDDGTSYTRKGETVNYEINGNTVYVNGSSYLASGNLTYSNGTLLDRNGTTFERQTITSDDRTNISKYYKNTDYENLDDVIAANVTVSSEYDYFTHTITLKSNLSNLYPNATINYGLEFGYNAYSYDALCCTNISSHTIKVCVCLDNESMYLASLKALQQKKASGQSLTSDEKALYNDIKPCIKNAAKNFRGRVYVEIEDERYYVYDLPTVSSSEIDSDLSL